MDAWLFVVEFPMPMKMWLVVVAHLLGPLHACLAKPEQRQGPPCMERMVSWSRNNE